MFVTTTHTKAMHEKWKENKHNPYFIMTGRKWIKETSGKATSEDKEKLWWCSFQHIEKMLSKNIKIHRNIEKSIETAQGWRCCHWLEPCFSPAPLPGWLTGFFYSTHSQSFPHCSSWCVKGGRGQPVCVFIRKVGCYSTALQRTGLLPPPSNQDSLAHT